MLGGSGARLHLMAARRRCHRSLEAPPPSAPPQVTREPGIMRSRARMTTGVGGGAFVRLTGTNSSGALSL